MNKIITNVLIISMFGFHTIGAMVGANPDQELLDGAIVGNFVQIRNALAQGANSNAVDASNTTALNYAAIGDHDDVAQYLLERGADPNIADNVGYTPLHYAVASVSADMVKLLLNKGADPTLRTVNGQTPADILQSLPAIQQRRQDAQLIRQYFIEVARPMPEIAL